MNVGMAPRRKPDRVQVKVRIADEVRKAIKKLAELHDVPDNDEITEALLAHLKNHDPQTCPKAWCVARRTKR